MIGGEERLSAINHSERDRVPRPPRQWACGFELIANDATARGGQYHNEKCQTGQMKE